MCPSFGRRLPSRQASGAARGHRPQKWGQRQQEGLPEPGPQSRLAPATQRPGAQADPAGKRPRAGGQVGGPSLLPRLIWTLSALGQESFENSNFLTETPVRNLANVSNWGPSGLFSQNPLTSFLKTADSWTEHRALPHSFLGKESGLLPRQPCSQLQI